jgi:hypothetical protein
MCVIPPRFAMCETARRSEVLAPGRAPLDDGQVSVSNVALKTDLVLGALGYSLVAPPMNSYQLQLRNGHGSGARAADRVVERLEGNVEPPLSTPVNFVVGFGCEGPDEFLQSIFGGWQHDRAGGVGIDPEHQPLTVDVEQTQPPQRGRHVGGDEDLVDGLGASEPSTA